MRTIVATIALFLCCAGALGQRPSDPALLVPAVAPALNYAPAPKAFDLPAGVSMGAPTSVKFDSKGHMFVLTRGDMAFFEFDGNGRFLRAFGDRLFVRAHGLRIDRDDNLWATDVGGHVVLKLSPRGDVLLTLGTKGEAGEWNEVTAALGGHCRADETARRSIGSPPAGACPDRTPDRSRGARCSRWGR